MRGIQKHCRKFRFEIKDKNVRGSIACICPIFSYLFFASVRIALLFRLRSSCYGLFRQVSFVSVYLIRSVIDFSERRYALFHQEPLHCLPNYTYETIIISSDLFWFLLHTIDTAYCKNNLERSIIRTRLRNRINNKKSTATTLCVFRAEFKTAERTNWRG